MRIITSRCVALAAALLGLLALPALASASAPAPKAPTCHARIAALCEQVVVTLEPAGVNCPNGGLKITIVRGRPDGPMVALNVMDDPPDSVFYVCNGRDGVPGPPGIPGPVGPPGDPGAPGAAPVVSIEPAGPNCAAGGIKIVAEAGTFYVCNGTPAPVCVSARVATWRLIVRSSVRVRRLTATFNGRVTTRRVSRTPRGRVLYQVRVDMRGLEPGVYVARVRYFLRRVGSRNVTRRTKVHYYRVGCPGQYGPGGLNERELTVL